MKRITITLYTLAALLLLTSAGCNRLLKDLTEKDVDVANIEFTSDDLEVFPAPEGSPEGTFNDFNETQTISLDDFEGADELKKYNKEHIKSVSCETVQIRVNSTNNKAGNVRDFLTNIQDIPNFKFTIADYTLGTIYEDQYAKQFVEQLMYYVLTRGDQSLTLALSGKTNLAESEKLKLQISIKGIRVKVQMAT
ncbi:MAG: hypothetical protein LBC81_05650 [Tannerellaceae bacterium]|jgi:hypothetical protein|nr:hypothetical protein [Tannerellaceae bacterium]